MRLTWPFSPFGQSIKVTVELAGPQGQGSYFWLILRGRTAATTRLPGGEPLPAAARLKSYTASAAGLPAYDYLPFVNSSAANGAVLMTVLAVRGRNFEFLEGEIRAGPVDGRKTPHTLQPELAAEPLVASPAFKLSSGTEVLLLSCRTHL